MNRSTKLLLESDIKYLPPNSSSKEFFKANLPLGHAILTVGVTKK